MLTAEEREAAARRAEAYPKGRGDSYFAGVVISFAEPAADYIHFGQDRGAVEDG